MPYREISFLVFCGNKNLPSQKYEGSRQETYLPFLTVCLYVVAGRRFMSALDTKRPVLASLFTVAIATSFQKVIPNRGLHFLDLHDILRVSTLLII